jgi:hypothetical protein
VANGLNLVQAVFDRDDYQPPEDVCVCTMHVRKVINNFPDFAPMDAQARADFTQDWRDTWTSLDGHVSGAVVLRELRYYEVQDARGMDMGDPLEVHQLNLPGAVGSSLLPPQVAASITFKTQHRKRWGRIYIPGLTITSLDGFGRIKAETRTDLCAGGRNLCDRGGTGAALCVFSRLHWDFEDVTQVQVDDVFDVIRSRRFDKPIARTVETPN